MIGALYMDVHVRKAVTTGLRMRGVDVVTAQEDGTATWPDDRLLDRAMELHRVLFSQDDDLLVEAEKRQSGNQSFAGVIYADHSHEAAINLISPNLENHFFHGRKIAHEKPSGRVRLRLNSPSPRSSAP